MPTYAYECEKCQYQFELFQKITDEPRKRCPKCRGKVRRLISGGTGLIFKGSGFFITDYKRNNNKSSASKSTQQSSNKNNNSSKKSNNK